VEIFTTRNVSLKFASLRNMCKHFAQSGYVRGRKSFESVTDCEYEKCLCVLRERLSGEIVQSVGDLVGSAGHSTLRCIKQLVLRARTSINFIRRRAVALSGGKVPHDDRFNRE